MERKQQESLNEAIKNVVEGRKKRLPKYKIGDVVYITGYSDGIDAPQYGGSEKEWEKIESIIGTTGKVVKLHPNTGLVKLQHYDVKITKRGKWGGKEFVGQTHKFSELDISSDKSSLR